MESRDRTKILNEKLENLKKWHLDRDRAKTIKVTIRTWDSLKSMKKENETFDDVVKELLNERTKSIGDKNIKAIKYKRKIKIASYNWSFENIDLSLEFEYNDVKSNKSDFTLDLKIKKVFFGKKIYNPSEFFGVDNDHKHYSDLFLLAYLFAVFTALSKEFGIHAGLTDYESLAEWKRLYYDYNLSEESFKADIEEPLRLSEEEKPLGKWKTRIKDSIVKKLMKEKRKK